MLEIKSNWVFGTDCYRKYHYVDELVNNKVPDKIYGLRILSIPQKYENSNICAERHMKIAEYKDSKNEWHPVYESMALYTSTCIERARQILSLRMHPNIEKEINLSKEKESKWWMED